MCHAVEWCDSALTSTWKYRAMRSLEMPVHMHLNWRNAWRTLKIHTWHNQTTLCGHGLWLLICILLMLTICFKVFPQDISQWKYFPLKGGHTLASSGHQSNTLTYIASFWNFMTNIILWNCLTGELNFACVGHKELQKIYHLGKHVVKCTKPGEWASIHAPSIVHYTTYFSRSPASTWEAWLLSTCRISKLNQWTFSK